MDGRGRKVAMVARFGNNNLIVPNGLNQ